MKERDLYPEELNDSRDCPHVDEVAAFRQFHDAVTEIAAASDTEEAFDLAAEAALHVTSAESSLVAVVRDGRIQLAKSRNVPQQALNSAAKADLSKTFFGLVIETGRPVAFVQSEAKDNPDLRGGHPGGGAICAVPAIHRGRPMGVIAVRRGEDRPFTPMEQRTLTALGVVVGAIAAVHTAASEARRAEARYSAVLKWLPGTAYVLSPDGKVLYLSDNFTRISGLSADQFINTDFSALVHPDDVPRLRAVLRQAKASPRPITQVDYRIRTARGTWTLRRASVGPLYGPDGQIEGFVGFARDISEEEARRRVLEAVPQFYAMMRASRSLDELCCRVARGVVTLNIGVIAAVWLLGPDGSAVLKACHSDAASDTRLVNKSAKTGLAARAMQENVSKQGDLADEPILEALCEGRRRSEIGIVTADVATAPSGTKAVLEIGFQRDDPLAPIICNHISLLTSHLVAAISEMEARHQLEQTNERLAKLAEELEQKAADLEQANAELEGFVYVASHDLKAPLTSISGMATLLERHLASDADEKALHYLQRIRANVEHLSAMIEDLLELSRVGRIEEPVSDVYVDQVIQEVFILLETSLEGIQVDHPAGWPVVRISRTRLQQIFTNLISNAVKYGCTGDSPRIELGWDDRGDCYEFFVRDFGPGIPEEYQQAIFHLFERGPNTDHEGTGIGLALVQKIVRHYGGKIWVESVPGQGATFKFTLPKPAAGEQEVQAA